MDYIFFLDIWELFTWSRNCLCLRTPEVCLQQPVGDLCHASVQSSLRVHKIYFPILIIMSAFHFSLRTFCLWYVRCLDREHLDTSSECINVSDTAETRLERPWSLNFTEPMQRGEDFRNVRSAIYHNGISAHILNVTVTRIYTCYLEPIQIREPE
jgi:hypothetical protein